VKTVSQWSSIRSAASFASKADDGQRRAVKRASSLSEVILGVQPSRERHRIRDRGSALCVFCVVLSVGRAPLFNSRQGLSLLHHAEAASRFDAIRLKRERQHLSVMSEEEEDEEEEIHYAEKTLFYWFSVRGMANVLRDNLASIKTPHWPLRCGYLTCISMPTSNTHQSCRITPTAVMSHD